MRVLALDTATEIGSIALLEEDTLLAQTQLQVEKSHSQALWRAIQFLLSETGWDLGRIDLWAVSTGPGSFTGVRIGMATIKGLAWATQKPVVGVSTLEILASAVAPTPYLICPVLDARRQEVYFAFYRQGPGRSIREVREPGHGSVPGLCGDSALIPEVWNQPLSGMVLAAIALKRFRLGERGEAQDLHPLYLRSTDAEFRKRSLPGKSHALESRP
jgi:tRNA threonylcarbamoyl adenosine modification protein YeaZ